MLRAFGPAAVTVTIAFVKVCLTGGKIMKFILTIVPPTATAQMKKVRVVRGRPMFYEPSGVKAAKALLISALRLHRPDEPMNGALELTAVWKFPNGRHKDGSYRVTRPDTDNLQKMLKDCMTQTGFWNDDAQVVREIAEKRWAEKPCIEIEIRELEEST
jgi:Holliday junction resolvase RusA-like endonuclease